MKTKDAFAIRELAEILSQNVLGLTAEYNFLSIFKGKLDGESLETYHIFRLMWKYFGGGDLPVNPTQLKPAIKELRLVNKKAYVLRERVETHRKRLKQYIDKILKNISATTDASELKEKLFRATTYATYYQKISTNINFFVAVSCNLSDRESLPLTDILLLHLGQRLRDIRLDRGLSQAAVAKRIGVTRVAWQKYEEGKREPPLIFLYNIATQFDISVDYLLGIND